MTADERIAAALTPLGYPVAADSYTGSEDTYLTFRYDIRGGLFTDDEPECEIYDTQVHFFCPRSFDCAETLGRIRQLLFQADFTWPEVTNAAGDNAEPVGEGRHFVFTCETAEGLPGG